MSLSLPVTEISGIEEIVQNEEQYVPRTPHKPGPSPGRDWWGDHSVEAVSHPWSHGVSGSQVLTPHHMSERQVGQELSPKNQADSSTPSMATYPREDVVPLL